MKKQEGLIFGIDLGIGSVGWAVLNDNGKKYIDKGVVKFSEAQKAEDRRVARGIRRRLHRKKYRIERMRKLLKENEINFDNTQDPNLLEKRIKGLNEKIELQDIVNIIYYFTRHRGYISFGDEERDSDLINSLREKYKYSCEIQKELIKINNKYRSTEHPLLHTDYEEELSCILTTQSKYYKFSNEFINKVLDIINTKRKFWEGPGAPREDSLSPYGRYRNLDDLEEYKKNPNYRKYLFQDLIGRCSVYCDEKRASAFNYYAEEFNFYNDFVNLKIPKNQVNEKNIKYLRYIDGIGEQKQYCFTTEAIYLIKDKIFELDKVNINKLLKDMFGIEKFSGYKTDSSGKPELFRFQTTKTIKNAINDKERYNKLFDNKDLYNKIIELIQISPDSITRKELLNDEIKKSGIQELLDEKFINELSEISIKDKRYHSFSEKALKKYLDFMRQDNVNSSRVERTYKEEIASDIEEDIIDEYLSFVEEGKLQYINDKFVEDIVASPATKKSLRKAIAVLNRLFNKYGYPEYISIETTRELLSPEKQKEYEKKTLDNNLKRNNAAKKLEELGIEINEANINKYLLLQESGNKCVYCNKDLKVENCEIEHILPFSITCDDSFDNKVASCTNCNHEKDNKSPYQFLRTDERYSEYKERILKNKNISENKKRYLLFEDDINKYEKKFKNRNLNDTAYATNELAKQIDLFKKAYEISKKEKLDIKVLRIPGQFTHICRTKYKLEKDRNLEYHHAVDAVIIANMVNTSLGKLINLVQNDREKYWMSSKMDEFRGKLFDNIFVNQSLIEIIKQTDFSNTRFSMEVNKNYKGQLFDANIRKAILKDGKYYYIDQIDNIYALSKDEINKKFKNEFLIKTQNPKLYEKLLQIIEEYKNYSGNPFVAYCKENLNVDWTKTVFNPNIHGIRTGNKSNSAVVIKLRFLQPMTMPFVLNKKSVNIKEGTINVCTTLSSYCTRVYKDNEKLYFMPIYKVFVNQNTGKIDTDNWYYKEVYNKFVGKDENELEYYMDLYNNEYIRFEDKKGKIQEGYVTGFHKTNNKVEMKKCNSIVPSCKNLKKIKSDILGLYNLNV